MFIIILTGRSSLCIYHYTNYTQAKKHAMWQISILSLTIPCNNTTSIYKAPQWAPITKQEAIQRYELQPYNIFSSKWLFSTENNTRKNEQQGWRCCCASTENIFKNQVSRNDASVNFLHGVCALNVLLLFVISRHNYYFYKICELTVVEQNLFTAMA